MDRSDLIKFATLFPIRLIFTLNNPGVIGSNEDAVNYYNDNIAADLADNIGPIVNAGFDLRSAEPDAIVELEADDVQKAILPLYSKACRTDAK